MIIPLTPLILKKLDIFILVTPVFQLEKKK